MSWLPIDWLASGILCYFILSRTGNFLLNLLAIFRLRDIEREKMLADLPQLHSGLEQPISVLLPLHNEAAAAVASTKRLLQLEYSSFEIVVINDGSSDATMEEMIRAFDLHPFPEAYRVRLQTQPVRGIYRSTRHKNLRVIDKEEGGTADALNAGINATRYPLFCSADSGMLLRRDCLQCLSASFINENKVVAATASLRAGNDCETTNGLLDRIALPKRWLPRLQVIDHLRTSLFAPLGWSICNAMLVAPPAISLMRKDAVLDVGGYDTKTTNAGMELIVRLHRLLRAKRQTCKIRFVPDPVCTRIVPDELAAWSKQRAQWQHGLVDSFRSNMRWPLRNAGVPGWIALPFTLFFEVWGPLIEIFSYVFMFATFACGLLSAQVFYAFLTAAVGFGILLSASGLLLEEMSFRTYPKTVDVITLALAAVLANLGYVQLDAACRSMGMLRRKSKPDAIG